MQEHSVVTGVTCVNGRQHALVRGESHADSVARASATAGSERVLELVDPREVQLEQLRRVYGTYRDENAWHYLVATV